MPYRHTHLPTSIHVYREIRARILSLELAPNVHLGEQGLADDLKVSRTPIREALGRLSAEGLVEMYPRRGAVVAPIRLKAVRTAQFVRETLEAAIVRQAAERATSRGVFPLLQTIEEQKLAERENEPSLFYAADEKMHRQICVLADQEAAWQLIEDAKTHMDRIRKLTLQPRKISELIDDHEYIVDAVRQKNADKAEKRVRTHLQTILPGLESLMDQYPDYFDIDENEATGMNMTATGIGQ
ncbi:MAG: GntR family transcriptional regulator [Alphaproteobacteria bacterium]|nr:GntR family transcriptional regulator [Alphaproteobacteria bacterium]